MAIPITLYDAEDNELRDILTSECDRIDSKIVENGIFKVCKRSVE